MLTKMVHNEIIWCSHYEKILKKAIVIKICIKSIIEFCSPKSIFSKKKY